MRRSRLWVTYTIAASDFRYAWKERSVIIWMFVMPLVFMFFFGLIPRGNSRQARAQLTIDNRDGGFLAEDLVDALRSENIAVVDSLAPGRSAVRTLVIPEDFTRSVLSRERVTLLLSRDEGANVDASEAAGIAVIRGLVRVVTGLIEIEAAALERSDERLAIEGGSLIGSLWELSEGGEGALDSIRVRLDAIQSREALVSVAASQAGRGREIPRGFQGSVPGTLVMFVLMSMVFSGTGITAERASGVLRRLGMTPAGRAEVVIGKLVGRIWLAGVQIIFLLLFGFFVFRIHLGSSPVALVLLMLAFAFCTGAYSILFGSLFRDPDQVSGFAIITTLTMAALGGCWWPLEVVPQVFKIIAFCLPTGWAMNGIHRIISFGYGLDSVLPHVGVLFGFGAIFITLASRKLKWIM